MPAEAGPRHRTVHYRRPQTQTSAKAELWTRGLQQWGRRLHHTQKITFFSKLIYEYITDQMYQRVWMDSVYNRMFGDYQEWRNGHCTNQIVGKNFRIVAHWWTLSNNHLLRQQINGKGHQVEAIRKWVIPQRANKLCSTSTSRRLKYFLPPILALSPILKIFF